MKEIISIPNASRTFEALRSLGYDLNSSIADVVDNSITEKVGAKNITINLGVDDHSKVYCSIIDDGCGMNHEELEEAMRLGTNTVYNEGDLGKFGMGMKTASLSHCNILTVISKRKRYDLTGYSWDIGHIRNADDWILLKLNESEVKKSLTKFNVDLNAHGTIVVWNDLFFIQKEYDSYQSDRRAESYIFRLQEQLKLHLRMVFHRYLDGSLGDDNTITINLNDEVLTAWDPFCREETNTEHIHLKKDLAQVNIPGYREPVRIDAYVLPNKESFSSEESWKDAKGLLSWNDSQGYYIYRSNRIIRFGGWHGTKAKDEHDKLARVSIDIDSSLDELFRITVNKTKVQFPEILFYHLKNVVNPFVVKKAKARYNKSDESSKLHSHFKKKETHITRISKDLIGESQIKTKSMQNGRKNDPVEVQNPSGTWLSNRIHDFLKYGSDNDFEIISDHFEDGRLWKIICHPNDKFKVVINASHPFYKRIYGVGANKAVSNALDAFIFSLAFAELYNKNDQNAHLFDTFKSVCSQALERLIKEEII